MKIYNKKTGEEIDIRTSDRFREDEKVVYIEKEKVKDIIYEAVKKYGDYVEVSNAIRFIEDSINNI